MGLFGKKTNKTVWRDKNGNITCPGDSCPKSCDNSCPIYLNTQAVILMQIGQAQKAIPIYDEALKIAPDFYDAWNNLGGIYGKMGDYQKAYDCYKKAIEFNKVKPNPVYGLMLATRDLGKYDECLSWCDIYKTISKDEREKPIIKEVKKKMGKTTQSVSKQPSKDKEPVSEKDDKIEVVKATKDNKWFIYKYKETYGIIDNTGDKQNVVTTPGGEMLETRYFVLAERLLDDIQKYGPKCMSAESVLPWHYTMIERFSKMEHKALEDLLDSCFMKKPDWTYKNCEDTWDNFFGKQAERVAEIRRWLSKCTHMQMTAACCIGNAYHSINVAYVLASIMENFKGSELQKQFEKLSKLIERNSMYGPAEVLIRDFETFNLYYGIHFGENGPIINNSSIGFAISPKASSNDPCGFMKQAKDIIDECGMKLYDINEFFDSKRLCEDIYDFCTMHYAGSLKIIEEYFISAFYGSLCLTIHHIKDEKSFSRENAYQFLQSKCDTEYCDVYSDRLLGYKHRSSDSEAVWEFYLPFLRNILELWKDARGEFKEVVFSAMEASFALGISIAYANYVQTDEVASDYVGECLSVESLIGRNYYHFTDGQQDEKQPFVINPEDVEIYSEEDESIEAEHDFSDVYLSAFISTNCWIKKISACDDETEKNRIIEIETDNNLNILKVTEIIEEAQKAGLGMMVLPGMEMPVKHTYEIQDYLSDEAKEEITLLLKQRVLPQNFSFVGKKLPQAMIEEGGNGGDNTNYTYAVQSAYRRAYMHMSIDTTEDGIIENLDYSTYQSTGSGYWDMFSRPQGFNDKHEEVVDMLLYIIDKYTDDEYEATVAGKGE